MKRKFFFLFVLFLFVLYYLPILHENPQTNLTNETIQQTTSSMDTNRIYPLPVSGYEHYIGKSVVDYQNRYGEPDGVVSDADGSQWWSYSVEGGDYVQLEVAESLIQSIFVLGDQVNTGALRIGMNRENVYDETQLAQQFYFDNGNSTYHLFLSKKNLELFPLVEFENNSFAMLFFNPEADEIYAIRYLTYDKLMRLNYYFIENINNDMGEINFIQKNNASNNQVNQKLLLEYVSTMRIKNGLEPYGYSDELSERADDLLNTLGNDLQLYKELSLLEQSDPYTEPLQIKFISGNQIYDSPMQFGLFLANAENRDILASEEYKEFMLKIVNDDLFMIMK